MLEYGCSRRHSFYSTYDLEDAFKAGFLSPIEMLAASDDLKDKVAEEVRKRIDKY